MDATIIKEFKRISERMTYFWRNRGELESEGIVQTVRSTLGRKTLTVAVADTKVFTVL
jgi:hypothetical protein